MASFGLLSGCSAKGFQVAHYSDLVGETIERPPKPIARKYHWVFQSRMLGKGSFYVDGPSEQKVKSGTSLTIPKSTTSAADLFAKQASYHRSAADRSKDRATRSSHYQSAADYSLASEKALAAQQEMERSMAGAQLVMASFNAAVETLKVIDKSLADKLVTDAIRWGLIDSGYIGPDAPKDTVLYIYMYRDVEKATGFGGHEWKYAVNLRLVRKKEVIESVRNYDVRIYTSDIPQTPPEGYVDAKPAFKVTGVDFGDFALLMRSAAQELYNATSR